MDANSLTTSNLELLKTNIDWPYELIFAEAHVLPTKNINPLEQMVLEIIQVFTENLPTLEEAAQQLGILEPAFLEKTIQQMIEQGLLEKDEKDVPDFAHCRIKTTQSDDSNDSSAIEKHGVRFCVDTVTFEHIPYPYFDLNEQPANPVIGQQLLPAKRQHLGLDKARLWVSDQDEPFINESGHMSDITLLPERGKFAWQTMPVTLVIDEQGHLISQLDAGTQLQQDWLDQQNIKQTFFSQLQNSVIDRNPFSLESEVSNFSAWKSHVEQLIVPNQLTKKVAEGIRLAKDTLWVHGFWLGIESLREAVLRSSCARKVVFAAKTVLDHIPGISDKNLSKVVLNEDCAISGRPLILADNKWGICLDRLSLTTSAGQQTEIIVPSLLKAASVVSFMNELKLY